MPSLLPNLSFFLVLFLPRISQLLVAQRSSLKRELVVPPKDAGTKIELASCAVFLHSHCMMYGTNGLFWKRKVACFAKGWS